LRPFKRIVLACVAYLGIGATFQALQEQATDPAWHSTPTMNAVRAVAWPLGMVSFWLTTVALQIWDREQLVAWQVRGMDILGRDIRSMRRTR
jgi:hypothetical protein